jgi:hypothetical protein
VIRVSSAQVYPHAHGEGERLLPMVDEPIRLADIDRVLEDSAAVAEANVKAPVRIWRDELAVVLESLNYARSVLTSDVNIVRHCLDSEESGAAEVVDLVPRLLSADNAATEVTAESAYESGLDDVETDWTVCTRSDLLMTAHEEMARADLSSPADLTRILKDLEAQLSDLARRHDAVEGRLHQVRAAILRQYETGPPSARDWLG